MLVAKRGALPGKIQWATTRFELGSTDNKAAIVPLHILLDKNTVVKHKGRVSFSLQRTLPLFRIKRRTFYLFYVEI